MMSKNSFLVNMKENLKRRNWIAVIYSVVFLLAFPVGMALWISSFSNSRLDMGEEAWRADMARGLTEYLSINVPMTLLVTMLAVICAIQGFAYLFRRQKLDMYMSVPVSKRRRFLVIYLNGILLFALPYLVSLLIGVGIGAGNGILTGGAVKCMLYSFLAYLVYYAAIYNITLVAVMMTGNLLLSLCATVVFLFYEVAVKGLFIGLCSIFFGTYSNYGIEMKTYLSPVIEMFESTIECCSLKYYDIPMSVPYLIENSGMTLLKILIIAIVVGVISYLLYAIRPAESCNKAIAFRKTKPVIKVFLMVPIALVIGVLFYSIANENTVMTVFGLILGILLSHSILEIIFEFDLKAAIRHLKSGAIGAVLVFAVFVVFRFDLAGYDTWVPKAEKVESVAFSIPGMFRNSYYDWESDTWISGTDYCFDKMKITDTESFCALAEEVVQDQKAINDGKTQDYGILLWTQVKYRMKNGTEKYRQLMIPYEKYTEQLTALTESEEYKNGAWQILDEDFTKKVNITSLSFSNGVIGAEVEKEEIKQVFADYKEDLKQLRLENVVEEIPVGVLYFDYVDPTTAENNTRGIYGMEMPIYSSFEKTIAYAGEKGYLEDWRSGEAEKITEITICRWDSRLDIDEEKTFTDKEKIEAILPALTPYELNNYRVFIESNDGYDAYVNFTDWENEDREDYSGYFHVDEALLPDFAIIEE